MCDCIYCKQVTFIPETNAEYVARMKMEDDLYNIKKKLFESLPEGEKWRAYFINPLILGAGAVQQSIQRTGLTCPECDSRIMDDGYCMMGHWCGKPLR